MPLEHRNFRAWIDCDGDGDILEEYKAAQDPEDEKVYTCWVASEAGKVILPPSSFQRSKFTSLIRILPCTGRALWRVCVTIEELCLWMEWKHTVTLTFQTQTKMVKAAVSRWEKGNSSLTPSQMSLSLVRIACYILGGKHHWPCLDDEAYLGVEQSTDTGELGNITLKINLVHARYQKVNYSSRRHSHRRRKEIDLYSGAIHETTKKICDHRITYVSYSGGSSICFLKLIQSERKTR